MTVYPTDLTWQATSQTGQLFSSTGRSAVVPVFSTTKVGLVPTPLTVGTARFLREDGTWQVAGSGINAIGNSGIAFTVNCEASNIHTVTMTNNVTGANFTIINPMDGQTVSLFITQDATGSRTLGWPTSFKWAGGVAGTISTAANAVDLLTMTYRSDTGFWYASLAKAFA